MIIDITSGISIGLFLHGRVSFERTLSQTLINGPYRRISTF